MAEANSSLMNYANMKRRAVSSKAIRQKIPSSNGTSFQLGQTINIDLPANVANTFFDFNLSYLSFKISNNSGATATFDKSAYSLINRLQILTGGQVISDLQNYNVLASALFDLDVSPSYKANVGNVLLGTTAKNQGISIADGDSHTFALPLILNPLHLTTPMRYIPAFSRDQIRLRITLEDAVRAFFTAGAEANSEFSIVDVEMVCYSVELSPEAFRMVDDMTGGVYNIVANDFRNATSTIGATDSTLTATLGFSMSSMESLYVVHIPQANNTHNALAVSGRSKNYLEQYQLFINGKSYPQLPIKCDDTNTTDSGNLAESLAETMIASHALSNYDHHSSINVNNQGASADGVPAGAGALIPADVIVQSGGTTCPFGLNTGNGADLTTSGSVGTFVASVELESLAHKSDVLYSGLDTIGSIVQYRGVYTGSGANKVACDVFFYARNSVLISLDTRGANVFVIST
tara:strand:- start:545 stop:1933 length:1389 start_codon:yes stop_codon:yes gene_type:complete